MGAYPGHYTVLSIELQTYLVPKCNIIYCMAFDTCILCCMKDRYISLRVHNNILLSCLQIIRTYYEKMRATLGHDQRFEFERDQNLITLDISLAGITTRDKAWTITALGPPVVGYHFLVYTY